jgi:hypothetical protein
MDNMMQIDDVKLFKGIQIFNMKVLGLVLGLLFGMIIFLATNWLILMGGHLNEHNVYVVGPHLQLLSQFFIGYKVSFVGSLIGLAYGFAVGTISGAIMGWIYNIIVKFRN